MGYKPEVLNPRPFPALKFGLQVRYILDFNIFQKYSICKHIYLFFVLEWVYSVTKVLFVILIKVFLIVTKCWLVYLLGLLYIKSIKILEKSKIPYVPM